MWCISFQYTMYCIYQLEYIHVNKHQHSMQQMSVISVCERERERERDIVVVFMIERQRLGVLAKFTTYGNFRQVIS